MPIYEYRCQKCDKLSSEYRSVDLRNLAPVCSCGGETAKVISAPSMVIPDIAPYNVPGTSKVITSRSQHREYLRSNGLIEVGNEGKPT